MTSRFSLISGAYPGPGRDGYRGLLQPLKAPFQSGRVSYSVEDLDGAGAPVDPDPVAAVQARGGVAAADDGGNAEFAGHDRGVRERRALRR